MFGAHFYWASLRKINAVFGNLFNNISVQRVDVDGNIVKAFKVPIEQAQKEHFLARLRAEELKDGSPGIGTTLPRLSYEFIGLGYNGGAKQQTSRYIRGPKDDSTSTAHKMWNPAPYIVNMDLSLYARTFDDALQILEQILPYFTPHLGLTINEIPELGIKNDITVQLDGLDTSVQDEGNIGDNRIIQWTLNFSVQTKIFHPTNDVGVIKKVIDNMHTGFEGDDNEKLVQIITQTVKPITADENDVYTIEKSIQEDGLPSSQFSGQFTPPFN
jgi:hypothetical protein